MSMHRSTLTTFKRQQNSTRLKQRNGLRGHFIRLGSIKRIARGGKFVRHDIAEIHEIVEAFLKGIGGGGIIYNC